VNEKEAGTQAFVWIPLENIILDMHQCWWQCKLLCERKYGLITNACRYE